MLCKNGVLRNFTKSTGKHLCQSLCFNNVAGLTYIWKAWGLSKLSKTGTKKVGWVYWYWWSYSSIELDRLQSDAKIFGNFLGKGSQKGNISSSSQSNFKRHCVYIFRSSRPEVFSKKDTLSQVFSYDFYEISKSNFFIENCCGCFYIFLNICLRERREENLKHFSLYLMYLIVWNFIFSKKITLTKNIL